jgi:uncharacterized protein YndB with AHSA1/START domain
MDAEQFDPGPLSHVEAHASGDRWALVFVRELAHPPEKVWAALTEPEQIAAWAPYTADRDLDTIGDATLTMIDGDDAVDLAATVRRADAPKVLEYSWGDDVLQWQLEPREPAGAGTRLTLRHTVEKRDLVPMVASGWHLCLVVAERLLDGEPIAPIRGQDALRYGWADLRDKYAERLDIPVTE